MFQNSIIKLASENTNFRQVIYTGKYSQMVLMSIPSGEEIGEETHETVDQILFFASGIGEAIVGGKTSAIGKDDAVFVPAGTKHNFINTGSTDLKIYTIYSPPNHPEGTVHKNKAEAEEYEKNYH
jgi:mannose-6-phosphate isomerase-like protein (cupin superfamily)